MFGSTRIASSAWRLVLTLCVGLLVSASNGAEKAVLDPASGPVVDLDAAALSAGPLANWANAGSAKGAFAALDQPPVVGELAGRQAVKFEAGSALKSSFIVPDELIKGKPFTVAVWAYLVEPKPREVLVSWASRPNGSAEFSYGPGNDGAFFGWDRTLRFNSIPNPASWHHLAWTFNGTELRAFVDGSGDASTAGKLSIKAGGSILLGAGWDGIGKKPSFAFKGGLARVQVWARPLSQREIRASAGMKGAFAPTPANGTSAPVESLKLAWEAGSDGPHAIRLAETEAALSDSNTAAQRLDGTEFQPKGLKPGQSVYWRVDRVDESGKIIEQGTTWRFTTDAGPATSPMPRDRLAGISRTLPELRWTPGRYAVGQTLYLGTDAEAVAKGSAEHQTLGAKAAAFPLAAGRLEYGKTYYWRVEQQNGQIAGDKGEVWSFRTDDEPIKNDVTFFVSSDTHYGLGNNAELNRKVIDQMNALPGTPMPPQAGGGIVRTPRGVVLNGDLLDKGFEPKTAPAAWAEFVRDYGLNGKDGRLGYPVYEGFGNHDGMTGKSISRAGIKERNPSRVGLTAISPNGFHYSWDWDQVHLVQLNLFPGKDSADCIVGPPNHHPEDSLGFLKDDLAKNVGSSGKIVIVLCHFCYSGGMADWWTEAAKDRFREAVKGYRTLLIHGHSHGAYTYEWKGLRAISDGSTARPDSQTGDFLVVRITPDELRVAQRKQDGWGITLKEPLPQTDRSDADAKTK